jgi:geranylgeranyl diphosphate synthase, type II
LRFDISASFKKGLMNAELLIEQALAQTIALFEHPAGPPKLAAAIRHAVFPGGARIRPKLCLAVANACNAADLRSALSAAVAIEFIHCASLVHDDLPCFDNAAIRRGLPSVHAAFGEPLAVLAGDALIVMAFQSLALGCEAGVLPAVLGIVAQGVGVPFGITAGQSWECEPKVQLADYQQAKTGALFSAATRAGAVSAGHSGDGWREFGELLGEAYQVADDIRDVMSDPSALGKPTGQDTALSRPSSARELGLGGALDYYNALVARVVASIPPCSGAEQLQVLVRTEAERLVPSTWTHEWHVALAGSTSSSLMNEVVRDQLSISASAQSAK